MWDFFCIFAPKFIVRMCMSMHVREKMNIGETQKIDSMKVYYVNSMQWSEDDVLRAFAKVKELIRADKNIKTITFLVGQQSQFDMLSPLKFTQRQISNRGFSTADGFRVQFQTLRTYHPNYVFVNQQPSEILIPICIPPQDLYKFEDYSEIAYWIISTIVSFILIRIIGQMLPILTIQGLGFIQGN